MSVSAILHEMLVSVAQALGEELRNEMVFVGGCSTSLLITDDFTRENVRHTDDVDLIVNVLTYPDFHRLQERLQNKGFVVRMPNPEEDIPACAMFLGDLRVDFMPNNERVLGFSNRWYESATQSAMPYSLTDDIVIKLVDPVYFVATKLDAYKGRGNNDPLESRDIEDILNLFDGRKALLEEIERAPSDVKQYIAAEIFNLFNEPDFDYAVQAQSGGDKEREELIFERLERVAAIYEGSMDE